MKRDMDLVREIPLKAEESPAGSRWNASPLLEHDTTNVVEDVKLLMDAGYVDARTLGSGAAMVLRITHEGHEFIDASCEPTRWERAKAKALSTGVPIVRNSGSGMSADKAAGIFHVSLERLALHYGMVDMGRLQTMSNQRAYARAIQDFFEFAAVASVTLEGTEESAVGRFLTATRKCFEKFA